LSVTNPSSGQLPAEIEPVNELERDIALLLRAENRDPFRLLGPHIVEENEEKRLVVRGYFPGATQASVLLDGRSDPITAGGLPKKDMRSGNSTIAMRLPHCFPISICI
jgi:hypothetical protein